MLKTGDSKIYVRSLELLRDYKLSTGSYKGRFVQIFLGLKFYQNEIPSMNSGGFVESGILQSMIDDLYSKETRPLNNCVLSLFENNYLPRTGVVPVGGTYSGNNWRNNFNIQKGIGCYAPASVLSSQGFLDEDRVNCRYLKPKQTGSLEGATCNLCSTGGTYRGENHRKWVQISPDKSGYAVTDILNTPNFSPYLAPDGNRIPVLPLIFALYHDSNSGLVPKASSSGDIFIDDFRNQFNFSSPESLSTLMIQRPMNSIKPC